MSRRLVPLSFWTLSLVAVALPLALRVKAAGPSARVPSVLGTWDGFVYDPDGTGGLALVRSVVVQQDHRRFRGDALVLSMDGRLAFNAINFAGTVARDDLITGSGRALAGRVVFQGGLESFEGGAGAAAVCDPEFLLTPVRGRAIRLPALLMRPFPAVAPPDIAGTGTGIFRSRLDPTFRGDLALMIPPRDELGTSFPGELDLLIPAAPHRFHLLATAGDDNRFVMIAQGTTGRLVAEGVVTPPADGRSTSVDALYRLILDDRPVDFGAINFSVGSVRIE